MKRAPVIPRQEQSLGLLERVVLVIEILMTYCRVRWTFCRLPLPDTVARLRATGVALVPEAGDEAGYGAALRLAYAVRWVLRLLPTDSRCLMRSLVLTRVLARRGLASTFHIGVFSGPEFLAHAWVQCGGQPVLPSYGLTVSPLLEL